jgi:hypothetical protein
LLCYVVVECTIIKPSTVDNNQQRQANIQQDDTYFVVKSPSNIHIDKLYLTFEFHRRPRLWQRTVIFWVILVALIIWQASRLVNETSVNTFPSHLDL